MGRRSTMKSQNYSILILLALCIIVLGRDYGFAQENQKLAQTGMQFLSVMSDARAASMAGAVTSLPMQSASLFFNPSTMANSDEFINLSASYNQWIGDIKHMMFSMSVRPAHGDYGVIGISLQTVDYGEVLSTAFSDTEEKGYVDLGIIKPTAFAVGLGYAKRLSDVFSVGGQVRYVHQNLGDSYIPVADTGSAQALKKYQLSPLSFDFGTVYRTPFRSLTFGMSVRNFSKELKYEDEGFELPLTFTIGLSFDVMDVLPMSRTSVKRIDAAVDLVHNRDYPEQVYFGIDINLLDMLALRGGYNTKSDQGGASFGFGVSQFGLAVDYCYSPYGVFNYVQRLTVRYSY